MRVALPFAARRSTREDAAFALVEHRRRRHVTASSDTFLTTRLLIKRILTHDHRVVLINEV